MKLNEAIKRAYIGDQPPSGGCVLKRIICRFVKFQ